MHAIDSVILTAADLPEIPEGTAYRVSQHVDEDAANPLEGSNITSGYIDGGHRRINAEWDADATYSEPYEPGAKRTPRPRSVTAEDVRRALQGYRTETNYTFSPATVGRWLRVFHGARGVYPVTYGSAPSVDASREAGEITGGHVLASARDGHREWRRHGENAAGLIWTPADAYESEDGAPAGSTWTPPLAKWAESTIETYAAWCEGNVYGYTVERLEWDADAELGPEYGDEGGDWAETGDEVGACWGFYGDDGDVSDPQSAARSHAADDIGGDIEHRKREAEAVEREAAERRAEHAEQVRAERAADREAVASALSYEGYTGPATRAHAAEVAIAALIARGSLESDQ